MEQSALPQATAWTPRRVALATLIVVAIAAAFWVLFNFRVVFFSLFTAIVLSTAIKPFYDRLTGWKIPRTASIIMISLGVLLVVIVLIVTVAPLLIEQWTTITFLLSGWYRDFRDALLESSSLLVRRIIRQMPPYLPLTLPTPAPDAAQVTEEENLLIIQQALNLAASIMRGLLIILGVALLTNFWILEGERASRFFLLAFPQDRRELVREFLQEIQEKVGAYTRGLVILSLIIGAMAMVAYLIIGLPNVLLLAIFAGIMEAVPLIGPLLGAIPAIVVAASIDPTKVIWVVVATLIFQTLENNLIVPRVMSRAVGVNPVVSLLAFIAFGSIFGFVGALLAIPLAAVIQITLTRFLFQASPVDQPPPMSRDAVGSLRYEAQNLVGDVRKHVRDKDTEVDAYSDQVEDAIEAIVQDLDSILAQVESSNGQVGNGKQKDRPA
jgi:predicted PurR-regulated permease PerM